MPPNIMDFLKSSWLQLSLLLFTAGIAWGAVASNAPRIEKLEAKYDSLSPTVIRTEQKVDYMAEDVRDIKRAFGIKRKD